MGWGLHDPYLCFPRDVAEVLDHVTAGEKGGDVDQARARVSEEGGELVAAFAIDRTVAGDRLNEKQPNRAMR